MKRWHVHGKVTGSAYLGVFSAETRDDAMKAALLLVRGVAMLADEGGFESRSLAESRCNAGSSPATSQGVSCHWGKWRPLGAAAVASAWTQTEIAEVILALQDPHKEVVRRMASALDVLREGGWAFVTNISPTREINALDWERAEQHLQRTEDAYKSIAGSPGVNIFFAAGILAGLRSRFDGGERTASLHKEIMELE